MISKRFRNDGEAVVKVNAIQKRKILEFYKKCERGIYKWEKYNCECGASSEYELLAEKDRYGLPIKTVICKQCGLIMTNPRLDEASNQEFYRNEYPYIYRAIENPDERYFERRVEYGRQLVSFIESKVSLQGKDVLDIGCAGGAIVQAFNERGYSGVGVDLSEAYVRFGQAKGINLKCCHSRELIAQKKKYDLIILNHVLEHFIDLEDELTVIKNLLKPEGVIYIAVPGVKDLLYNYNGDFLQMIQSAHIYNFTKDTLRQVLKKYGFDVVYANERIEAIFRFGEPGKIEETEYENVMRLLQDLEDKQGVSTRVFKDLIEKISSFSDNEVLIYGTGQVANRLMDTMGKKPQIKGFLTKDTVEDKMFREYPVFEISEVKNVKCIVIASRANERIIYQRIKHLEKDDICIIGLDGCSCE